MKNRLFQIVLLAIIACSCALMSSAHSKLTPSAQLSLLQKRAAKYDQTARNFKHLMPTRASGLWWRLIPKMRRARLPKSVRQALPYCQNSGIRLLSAFLPTRLMPSLPSRAMSLQLKATCGLTSLAVLTTPCPRHLESTSTQARNTSSSKN